MRDLLFVKTELTDLKKLQINMKFYQALGVDYLVVGPNPTFFKEILRDFLPLMKPILRRILAWFFPLISRS